MDYIGIVELSFIEFVVRYFNRKTFQFDHKPLIIKII